MNNRKIFFFIKALFFAFLFVVLGFFNRPVYAECAAGWHCVGTTVIDFPTGCETHYTASGHWCETTYEYTDVSCLESTCAAYYFGNQCISETDCGTTSEIHNTNCCEQDTGPYCGDGSCNGSETCSSCSTDCGSCCSPSCPTACGQGDDCGGTCSNSDAGAPAAPTLDPANGGTVYVTEAVPQTTVNWSAPLLADSYQLELYPAGTNCLTSGAYCNSMAGLTYTFIPLFPRYFYRVRALNSTCSTQWGNWAAATFSVRGTISGTVKQDDNRLAVEDPATGVCVLAGAGGIQPGAGSEVVVNGVDSGDVNVNNGTYSLSSSLGSSKVAVLAIGDPANWDCTCPSTCTYSTTAPKSGLNYFVSNIKDPWWQVDKGNIHADGGNVVSNIPATATKPYLITGTQPGLVSYSGSLSLGDAGVTGISETSNDWRAKTRYQGLKTGYGYFERILEDDPSEFGVWSGGKPAGNGVFLGNGATGTSGGNWNVSSGQVYVILVPNNVTINNNINVDPGGFLAIISSGNITIANTVTDVQGVYIADGIISSGTGESQLIGEGIFTGWLGIDLSGRDFNSTENNFTPVERFIYRPDLVRNAYRYLLKPKIAWQEVAP